MRHYSLNVGFTSIFQAITDWCRWLICTLCLSHSYAFLHWCKQKQLHFSLPAHMAFFMTKKHNCCWYDLKIIASVGMATKTRYELKADTYWKANKKGLTFFASSLNLVYGLRIMMNDACLLVWKIGVVNDKCQFRSLVPSGRIYDLIGPDPLHLLLLAVMR